MKTKAKHIIDRPPLTSEEINSMQDFNAVLKGGRGGVPGGGKKGGNGGWYFGGSLLLLSAVLVLWILNPTGDKEAKSRQVEQKIPETMPRTQEGSEDIVGAPPVKPPDPDAAIETNPAAILVSPGERGAGSDQLIPIEENPQYLALMEEIRQLEKRKPREPKKANKYRPHFDLKIDTQDYPELAGFMNMQFEVAPEDKSFSEDHYKVDWNDIQLKRHSGDRYRMVLTQDRAANGQKKVVELIVIPVISEAGFAAVKADYDKRLREYEKQLAGMKQKAETLRSASQ